MDDLSGLCRLVVIPKVSVDKSPEVTIVEKTSPTKQRAPKLLGIKPV